MISKHQQKYLAHSLTRLGGQGIDKLSQSLFNANVDLNPHQVEGALFALRSPFNNGVLLADEVGLGKTIEAALVISQYVAEKKSKILIIAIIDYDSDINVPFMANSIGIYIIKFFEHKISLKIKMSKT